MRWTTGNAFLYASNSPKWVYIVIAIIIIALVIILFPGIIPILVKILLLPIKLLWWLLKAIGKGFAALFHKRE